MATSGYEINIPEVYTGYRVLNGQMELTGTKLYPGYYEKKMETQ